MARKFAEVSKKYTDYFTEYDNYISNCFAFYKKFTEDMTDYLEIPSNGISIMPPVDSPNLSIIKVNTERMKYIQNKQLFKMENDYEVLISTVFLFNNTNEMTYDNNRKPMYYTYVSGLMNLMIRKVGEGLYTIRLPFSSKFIPIRFDAAKNKLTDKEKTGEFCDYIMNSFDELLRHLTYDQLFNMEVHNMEQVEK